MPYQPTTNFRDSNGVDLGKKLVTKDYLLEVYGSILESLGNSGLTVTPALWVWGTSGNNQAGRGTTNNASTPVTTFAGGTNWKQVSAGGKSAMAIKTDGTLWVWGLNTSGQLGINNTTSPIPTPVTTFAGGTNWKQVACGYDGSAAIKTDGTLWTWGNNNNGQLGINVAGATNGRTTPVTTFAGGTNWKSVATGGTNMVAIKTDGTLWTWGRGAEGQLGTFDNNPRTTPVTTFAGGTNWKSIATLYGTTAAVKTDGTLWTWGNNSSTGSLGANLNTGSRNTPITTFSGGTNWKSVSISGFNFASVLAIKTDGTLWCWGYNQDGGNLGINNTTDKLTPVTTFAGGTNWKSVSGQVAIKTDGTLWTWGSNFVGLLGNNSEISRSTPVTTFLGGNDWKQASYIPGGPTYAIRSNDYI